MGLIKKCYMMIVYYNINGNIMTTVLGEETTFLSTLLPVSFICTSTI